MLTLLVHNPTAGSGDHEKEELLAILRLAGHDVDYMSTKSARFPAALDGGYGLIVIAGGDGTVRKVVTRMQRRDAAVAIFPHGTANNIARSLGMTRDRQAMAIAWREARRSPLDIGIVSGPWGEMPFIEGVGLGALASITNDEVGADFEGDKRILIGRDKFREALAGAEPLQVEIAVDGKPFEGEWLMVEVLNNLYTGPALPLAPRADSGDGLLDVIAVPADRRERMLAWLGAPEDSRPPVVMRRGAIVSLAWSGRPVLRVDDSPVKIPARKQQAIIQFQPIPLSALSSDLPAAKRPAPAKAPRKAPPRKPRKKGRREARPLVAA